MSRLAVLFPGIGYNFDRPLLHFAAEQAAQFGYEVLKVSYSGFPPKIRGDREKMAASLALAREQTETILKDVDWHGRDSVIFISKSIGTVVAAQYAWEHHIPAGQILFTPFPETFRVPMSGRAAAFHAETDPWMDNQAVLGAAEKAGVPMKVYPEGNHSLETGDTVRDIEILEEIFRETEEFFRGRN